MFKNREEAGEKLAKALQKYRDEKEILIIGIPKGGVIVAAQVADALKGKLAIIPVAKIAAPKNPELAIGAIAADEVILDRSMIHSFDVTNAFLEEEIARKGKEVQKAEKLYQKGISKKDLSKTTLILVDDGIATGSTMMAVIESLRKKKRSKTILAVPVAPLENLERFVGIFDEIICLEKPDLMMSIGEFYRSFPKISEKDVIQSLKIDR